MDVGPGTAVPDLLGVGYVVLRLLLGDECNLDESFS